jgi:hypothetical protein
MKEKEAMKERAYTSFGRLVMASERTAPMISKEVLTIGFPNADRFCVNGEMVTIPKDNPGPKYVVHDNLKYKNV